MTRKVVILAAVAMLLPAATAMAFHPNENCDRCHVPHNAKTDQGAEWMPLWNPETASTETVFDEYYSHYLDADPGDPTGSTLLCLSCHDGTGSHRMMPSGTTGDMSGSHPQEFAYDAALVVLDDELKDPDQVGLGHKGGSIAEDMLDPVTHHLKCTSCHDVHIQGLHGGASVEAGESLPLLYPPGYDGDDDADPGDPVGSRRWRVPHLVDVGEVGWELSRHGSAADPDDWQLTYGALCRTCHIK